MPEAFADMTVKEAAELLARRAAIVRLVKAAGLVKTAGVGDFFSDPRTLSTLGGAAAGGLLGYGSSMLDPDEKQRHPWRNALTGALAGGATGFGISQAMKSYNDFKHPEPDADATAQRWAKGRIDAENAGKDTKDQAWDWLKAHPRLQRGLGWGTAGSATYNALADTHLNRFIRGPYNPLSSLSRPGYTGSDSTFQAGVAKVLGADSPFVRDLNAAGKPGSQAAMRLLTTPDALGAGVQEPGSIGPARPRLSLPGMAQSLDQLQTSHPALYAHLLEQAQKPLADRRLGYTPPVAPTPSSPVMAPADIDATVNKHQELGRRAMAGDTTLTPDDMTELRKTRYGQELWERMQPKPKGTRVPALSAETKDAFTNRTGKLLRDHFNEVNPKTVTPKPVAAPAYVTPQHVNSRLVDPGNIHNIGMSGKSPIPGSRITQSWNPYERGRLSAAAEEAGHGKGRGGSALAQLAAFAIPAYFGMGKTQQQTDAQALAESMKTPPAGIDPAKAEAFYRQMMDATMKGQ